MSRTDIGIVLALLVLAFGWRLGEGPLTRTEPHRAIAAHQMSEGGDWLIPRLWGERYLAKPPLHYWILAVAERVAGTGNELIWRAPSVLASALTALLVGLASGRWFGRAAGLIAGCSFLGLVALWSQNVKADIDATHTLAVTATALGLLELGRADGTRSPLIVALTGLAFGCVLLLKGPAGLPVVAAALIGPAIVNRTWRPLRRLGVYAALGVGVLLFAGWVLAAWREVGDTRASGDVQGVQEVLRNLLARDASDTLKTLTLPVVMFAYALPFSLLVPWSLGRGAGLDDPARRLVRAISGAFLVALVIGAVAGMVNPRYLYIALPLLCPLAGAFGQACFRGAVAWPHLALVITSITLAIVHLVLAGTTWHRSGSAGVPAAAAALVPAALAVAACVWTVAAMHRLRWRAGLVGLLVSLVLLRVPFAEAAVVKRNEASPREAARLLRETIGEGVPVTADAWVMTAPQLFFYAGVDVDYVQHALQHPREFDEDRWIVFCEQEWRVWKKKMRRSFDSITPLPFNGRTPVLVRYRAGAAPTGDP